MGAFIDVTDASSCWDPEPWTPRGLPRGGPRSALAAGLLPLRRLQGAPSSQSLPVPPGEDADRFARFIEALMSFPADVRVAQDGAAVELTRPAGLGWTVA